MAELKRCIGFGVRDGTCQNRIDIGSLALNGSGLWCVECERARREHIDKQMAAIRESFEDTSKDGEGS